MREYALLGYTRHVVERDLRVAFELLREEMIMRGEERPTLQATREIVENAVRDAITERRDGCENPSSSYTYRHITKR